jgi:hypothetical protein
VLNDWDKMCKKEKFGVNYGKFLHMCTAKSYSAAFNDISQELFMAFQVRAPWGPGLGWAGLGWAGLGWAGLGWAGLGWAGLASSLRRHRLPL